MTSPHTPPPLDSCLNLKDFENAAHVALRPKAWAYYHSAADNSETAERNTSIYSAVRFRPRALVDVSNVDISRRILGWQSQAPFFISPAAMGKLAHKDGELCLVRGAGRAGIHYAPSTMASIAHKDLSAAAIEGQVMFYQLYVDPDKNKTAAALLKAKTLGFKAILVTVDTPISGNREEDLRTELDASSIEVAVPGARVGERASTISISSGGISSAVTWSDLAWYKEVSGLPIVVKGIQTVEDALLAVHYGVKGIMLSNHGGRQVNTAPSPLEILLEIRKYHPEILSQTDVILDSGIRRGTDIVIALCLGASAVSLGRPFMYSLIYGDDGVFKVANILKDEVRRAMALLGVIKIEDLNPTFVNTSPLERLMFDSSNL